MDLVTAFHTQTAQACLDQRGANFSFEEVIVLQHQMDKQPFARWSADMIIDFQFNVATAGLRRAMFISSTMNGDNKYMPLSAWLTYLAQGSQDTTTVSNEFQSVASAASVVAVWRVKSQLRSFGYHHIFL